MGAYIQQGRKIHCLVPWTISAVMKKFNKHGQRYLIITSFAEWITAPFLTFSQLSLRPWLNQLLTTLRLYGVAGG
jgi:hypothetical protein